MAGKADLPSGKHNKGHLPHCFAPSCHAAAGGSMRPFSAYISTTIFTLKTKKAKRERERGRKAALCKQVQTCMLNLLRTCHPALRYPQHVNLMRFFPTAHKSMLRFYAQRTYATAPSKVFYLILLFDARHRLHI